MDENVIDFLIRAKQASYAGGGAESAPSRPGSHDLRYAEGPLAYIDTYIGGDKFAGQEAVWRNGAPIWAMNYVGRVLGEGFDGGFLKEVLLRVTREHPYRGPLRYERGDCLYVCHVKGEFDWFYGYEEIMCKDAKVFECAFHGGEIG